MRCVCGRGEVLVTGWQSVSSSEPVDKVAALREFRVLHTALHGSSSYREAVSVCCAPFETLGTPAGEGWCREGARSWLPWLPRVPWGVSPCLWVPVEPCLPPKRLSARHCWLPLMMIQPLLTLASWNEYSSSQRICMLFLLGLILWLGLNCLPTAPSRGPLTGKMHWWLSIGELISKMKTAANFPIYINAKW